MKPRVKICGLTRPEDVEAAILHGAAYLGFIVEAKSSRRLSVAEAAKLSLPAKASAKTVAVTVNPDDALLRSIAEDMQPDSHMKAAEQYAGVADFILYDAKPPKGEVVRGGHGLSFDWSILTDAPLPKTWALAGGLTPENAAEAVRRTKAPILDVSSGLEASPGIKDAAKIQAFMDAVSHG